MRASTQGSWRLSWLVFQAVTQSFVLLFFPTPTKWWTGGASTSTEGSSSPRLGYVRPYMQQQSKKFEEAARTVSLCVFGCGLKFSLLLHTHPPTNPPYSHTLHFYIVDIVYTHLWKGHEGKMGEDHPLLLLLLLLFMVLQFRCQKKSEIIKNKVEGKYVNKQFVLIYQYVSDRATCRLQLKELQPERKQFQKDKVFSMRCVYLLLQTTGQ